MGRLYRRETVSNYDIDTDIPLLTLGTRVLLELLFKVLDPSGSISVHGGVVGHCSARSFNEIACGAV